MPSAQKRKILEKSRKREKRGRNLFIATILIAAAAGASYYAYALVTAPKPDFTIAAPIGVTIHAGTPSTSLVNVTAVNQFSGTVLLTAKGSPGLNVSINPSSLAGSGQATLTASSPNNGSYTVTVTGTSGSLTHSVTPKVATPVLAKFVTSGGTIIVELYQVQTPKTVANFISLAQSGFYTNLTWHRIVRSSPAVIQTGDPNTKNGGGDRSTWGTGGSSQTVPLEIDPSLHNNAGYLGMARSSDPNSGSSQFYINMGNNNYLDGGYTVFGKVISGMDAATTIWNTPTNSSDQPVNPVFLNSVTITSS
jgi:cyclophilin family peptidyl-prolyl cis-trans isomerase